MSVALGIGRNDNMKWNEIRKSYPDKFVLLESLNSHIENNKKIIDDVALVRIIDDPKEASNLLVRCKGDMFIFHTAKEELDMKIVTNPVFRGVYKNENRV
ncbi:hypothetical protein [Tepidibacter sp. Z1-5]|uniref:hypothetical protein n=1 Tax=Tepidibacter sp. Z1-5 TaxID=3134138 RepID=UPI0030ECAC45